MSKPGKLKITIVGAGSISFCPCTIGDILISDRLNEVPLEICLMDIAEEALKVSENYAREASRGAGRNPEISSTTVLDKALEGADFVVTAIEKDRYHYWSQDFHVPRKYGFRQVYGENGGPGGMFHTLRNLGPMLEIAKAMERICPNAWLLNYTNPEAKLIEAIYRLTGIKAVGLCHGMEMGKDQLSEFLEIPKEDLETIACGLNHFGWFQSIKNRKTGEDLYPLLMERERKAQWLASWDEIGLSRIMFRTYGLWPYPGTNHIGEYIAWSDEYLASSRVQYFYDPVHEDPWNSHKTPTFVYSFAANPTAIPLFDEKEKKIAMAVPEFEKRFLYENGKLKKSGEVGIPIIEAIAFKSRTEIGSVNMPNKGKIPGLPDDMVVELPAIVDGTGIHPEQMAPLPEAVTAMLRTQGAIHKLVIEAYAEQSRNKLLQAVLLDPTISSYNNAVSMINELCELQKDILPPLHW